MKKCQMRTTRSPYRHQSEEREVEEQAEQVEEAEEAVKQLKRQLQPLEVGVKDEEKQEDVERVEVLGSQMAEPPLEDHHGSQSTTMSMKHLQR